MVSVYLPGLRPKLFAALTALAATALAVACEPVEDEPSNNNNTAVCPNVLPQAFVSCNEPECMSATATRTFARAELSSATSSRWLAITHTGSDLLINENLTVSYTLDAVGGLTAQRADSETNRARRRAESLLRSWGPDVYASVLGQRRRGRAAAERALRRRRSSGPTSLSGIRGTSIAPRRVRSSVESERRTKQVECSMAEPSCGADALCIIPEGMASGSCESALTLKFRPDPSTPATFDSVAATVRAVGRFGAIVVDDDDADALSTADANTLLDRFERRIAPLDHAVFGLPRDDQGQDRDGNGVVILFVTSRVGQLDLGGPSSTDLVGFFQPLDLRPTTEAPGSNAADLLYLQPPGPNISLDALSGTIGHEYQHLINYYAKVINRGSSPEEVWLDEGLSTFAEDMLGYGADAFRNIAAYLVSVSDTSFTGNGLINAADEADSLERRGAVHLLIRYVFEQAGGATYGATPDAITDNGGIAAVRALVQRPDTGLDAFEGSGRSFPELDARHVDNDCARRRWDSQR